LSFVVWCSFVPPHPPLPCPSSRHSTHDPPHEQLLVGLGAGGVSFGCPPCCRRRPPFPPSLVVLLTISQACSTPPSTLRAVARSSGGWCGSLHRPLTLASPSPCCLCGRHSTHVPPHKQWLVGLGAGVTRCRDWALCHLVVGCAESHWCWCRAPIIHPASSCSQAWGHRLVFILRPLVCIIVRRPLSLVHRFLVRASVTWHGWGLLGDYLAGSLLPRSPGAPPRSPSHRRGPRIPF
jgi:hypothetical protein